MNWKHIVHIVRKDFRAQRFHIVLWVILLALYAITLGHWDLNQPAGASLVTVLVHLLPGVVIVYGLAIAVVLMHQDPVAGTSAFWLTRPVRPPSLLAAKSLEIAAMSALWFAADFLVLVGNGVPGHTGYLLFSIATGLFPAMLAVLAIAALAPNTPRFFLAFTLAAVGYGLIAMILNLVTSWFFVPETGVELGRTLGQKLSAQVVGVTIASIGSLAILGWQFLTRRTGTSIAAALIFGGGASIVFASWSHDLFTSDDNGDASDQFNSVKVEIDPSEFRSGHATVSAGDGVPLEYRTVSAQSSIRDLPDGVFAEWESTDSRVVTSAGQEFVQIAIPSRNDDANRGLSAALGGAKLAGNDGGWSPGSGWNAIVRTSDEDFEQFANQPCTVETEFQLELFRYNLLGELPLERGAELRHGGLHIRITHVFSHADIRVAAGDERNAPHECEILFQERFPNSKLQAVLEGNNRHLYSDLTYLLVNREKNEAIVSNGGGYSSFGGIRMMFHTNDRRLKFHPAGGSKEPARFNKEWFDGATLAVLRRKSLGQITRTTKLEDVVFE